MLLLPLLVGQQAHQTFTTEQAEMAAQANATAVAENGLTNSLQQQAIALEALIAQYNRLNTARMPGGGAAPPLRMATGGRVPGAGNTDRVPALLTPGEFVVKKDVSQKNAGFLHALNNGSVKGFLDGGDVGVSRSGSTITLTGQGGASTTIQLDPNLPESELVEITEKIKRAVSQGIVVGTQQGLDEAQAAYAADPTYFDQAGRKEQGWGYVGAHDTEGVKMSGAEALAADDWGGIPDADRLSAFLRGDDIPADSPVRQELIAIRQEMIEIERLSSSIHPQPEWLNDASKRSRDNAANAKQAARSMLRMQEDPSAPNIMDGRRAAFDRYADEKGLSPQQRASGHAKITEAEQRIVAKLRDIEANADNTAKWVESSEQTTHAIDVVWNDVYHDVAALDVDPEMADFDQWSRQPGKAGRSTVRGGLSEASAARMGGTMGRARTLTTADGGKVLRTSETRAIFGQGGFYENMAGDVKKRTQQKQQLLDQGVSPEEVALLEAQAQAAGVDVGKAFAMGIKQGMDAASEMVAAQARELGISLPQAVDQGTESSSPSRAAERSGKNVTDGLAQGIRNNADDPVVAARQVGEQMELAFDESFDGQAAGRDAMQETEQGMRTGGTGAEKLPGQKRSRMQGSQMAQMGIGMGVSALSTIPMMTGQDNIAGVSSEFMMTVGMATGQVAAFASMLPVGGAAVAGFAAAVGLAAFGLEILKKRAEKTAEEAYELGSNLGAAADAAKKMSDVFGKATAIQKQNQLTFSEDEQETADEFAAALGSEGGKALVEELSGEFGAARIEKTAQYIESAIVNGMIEADQAGTFAKSLANAIGDRNLAGQVTRKLDQTQQEDYTRTRGALSLAEKRDRAVREDGTVGTSGIKGTAATIGASVQALQDWTTVAAVARSEYAEGVIGYKEYIEVLNKATEAQSEYSDMLRNATSLSPSTPYTNEKSIEKALLDMGLNEDQIKNAFESLDSSLTEQFESQGIDTGNKIERWLSEKAAPIRENIEIDPDSFIGRNAEITTEYDGAGPMMGHEFQSALVDAELAFTQLYSITGNYATSLELASKLQDENSQAYKTYTNVMTHTKDEMAALQATIATINNLGTDSNLTSDRFREAFESGFANSQMNPESYAKLFSEDQTAAQTEKQLQYSVGSYQYRDKPELGSSVERKNVAAGLTNDKQRAEYADAMGSIAEIVGPDMQDKLTEYVAAGIRNGSVDGGTEGITELEAILGDQEAVNMYIDFALEDGKLEAGELKEIAEQLAYIKAEIPPDMRLLFGIDIENPEDFAKLQDPTTVDTLRSIGLAMEELPEEEKQLGAEFAMSQINNGKPISLKSFRKDFKEIKKLTDDMEGKSAEQKREMLIDVITKVNGGEVDPAEVTAVYDDLLDTYGAGIIANLPPTTLTKVVNMQIEATQMKEKARELLALALLAKDSDGIKEAKDLLEKANALDDGADDIIAAGSLSDSGSSGGGGGGGGDEGNWIKDIIKEAEQNEQYLEDLKKIREKNLALAKESQRLSAEIMEAIASDPEAAEDYLNGKYSNKEIKQAYYKNMRTDTRRDTDARTRSAAREQEVESSDLDYFTKQQILADEKLTEMYAKGGKARQDAIDQAEERAAVETTILDRYERQVQLQQQLRDYESQRLDTAIKRAEYEAENAFFADKGIDRAALDQRQAEIAADIKVLTMEQIDPIKENIEEQKRLIKELERQYEVNEDNIDSLKDQVDERKRMVEDMQRALELRQREGEMLDHDLKLMGYVEEEINKVYDERIEALNKVADINQQIAQSQKDQLGLADALSRGDIGAAALAAQQMQQNQMQFASEQYQGQLETNRDNAIASLTGAESGLTREQIEMRKRELEEDSYQTNLQIRAVEDEIYDLNRKIRDENDIIAGYKDTIETHNKNIRDYEWDIYNAEQLYLADLKKEEAANNLLLAQADQKQTYAGNSLKIQKARWDRESAIIEAENALNIAGLQILNEQGIQIASNTDEMIQFGKAAAAAYQAIKNGEFKYKGKKKGKNYAEAQRGAIKALQEQLQKDFDAVTGGVNTMLDANVNLDKIAIPDMATASFNLPVSAVPNSAVNGIMGSVTNNFNNNNVNVNAASANAHEVAQIVLREINWMEGRNVK